MMTVVYSVLMHHFNCSVSQLFGLDFSFLVFTFAGIFFDAEVKS